jgi:hypothetical protein
VHFPLTECILINPSTSADWVPQGAIYEETHILPFSLNDLEPSNQAQTEHKTQLRAALRDFSGGDISALQGEGINSVENALTLSYASAISSRSANFFQVEQAKTELTRILVNPS